MNFIVGEKEQHKIDFNYETMWGKVKILIDGKEHTSTKVMMMGYTPFIFQVGEKEKHQVKIELHNPAGFAFRGSDVKAYVDEKLVHQNHVKGNLFVLVLIFMFFALTTLWLVLR